MEAQNDFTFSTTRRSLSVRANAAWMFGGMSVYALAQWAILASISKLGTSFKVGQFALGLAIAAPVYNFTNMQLRTIQATDARGDFSFPDYFGLRVLTSVAGFGVVILLGAFNGGSQQTRLIVVAIGLAKCLESLSDCIYGLCQKRERMKFISVSLCVKGIGSVAAVIAVLRLTGSLFEATLAMAAWWMLLFLFVDLRWAALLARLDGRHPGGWLPHYNWKSLVRLVLLAFPMGIQTMLASLAVSIPRFITDRDLGTAMLGKYAALAYFIVAGQTVITAVGNSVQAALSHRWYSSLQAFRQLLLKCVAFAFLVGIAGLGVAAIGGKAILTICYSPEYAMHQGVFVLLMGSSGFYYIGAILAGGVAIVRMFWMYTFLYSVVPLMALLTSWLLIPRAGLIGAAIATLAYCVGSAAVPAVVIAIGFKREARLRTADGLPSAGIRTFK